MFAMNKFLRKSFSPDVSDYPIDDATWRDSMELWVLYGLPPGSFLEAVLANDLTGAALKTHPMNRWQTIVGLVKWLHHCSPKECHGSYEQLKKWQELTNDERMEKCVEIGLMPTAWEILNNDPKWMFYGTEP